MLTDVASACLVLFIDAEVNGESKQRDQSRDTMLARHDRERALVEAKADRKVRAAEAKAAKDLERARREVENMKAAAQRKLAQRAVTFRKRFEAKAKARLDEAQRKGNILRQQLVATARRNAEAVIAAARKTGTSSFVVGVT